MQLPTSYLGPSSCFLTQLQVLRMMAKPADIFKQLTKQQRRALFLHLAKTLGSIRSMGKKQKEQTRPKTPPLNPPANKSPLKSLQLYLSLYIIQMRTAMSQQFSFVYTKLTFQLILKQLFSCRNIVLMDKHCNFQTHTHSEMSQPSEHLYIDRDNLPNFKIDHITQTSSCQVQDETYQHICSQITIDRDIKNLEASNIFKELSASNETPKDEKNSTAIFRAGFLQRRSSSFFKHWMTRFCFLTPEKLLCYEDETRTTLISCLSFKRVKCEVEINSEDTRIFYLHCEEERESFTFKAQSKQQAHKWHNDLYNIIDSFRSQQKIKIRQALKDIYKQKDAILQLDFLSQAQTGDILLMKTSDPSCAIQRFITHSEYDHVSMVVRFNNNDIKIFEANADEGVQIYSWEDFQGRFNNYQKMCSRKLYHPQKSQLHSLLLKFIKKMIGSTYKLDTMKIIRKHSDQEMADSPQSFFCSELIAKAFKYMGLLSQKKVSSSYWPIDFTDRSGVIFQGGSALGSERLILLKKHTTKCQ